MGRVIRPVLAVLCALTLAGCVTPGFVGGEKTIRALFAQNNLERTIDFVTTRCNYAQNAGAPGSAEELYRKRCWEAARGDKELVRLGYGMADAGAVNCGTARVTVARAADERGVLTTVDTPAPKACDYAELRRRILQTACKCALIVVHGYNTTFGYGLRRTAQLSLDVASPGVYDPLPILFSFAAGGRFNDYVNDVEAAELSVPALHQLLLALSSSGTNGAPNIDVVAHSMGSRIALRAMTEGDAPALRYVVTAAPDVDPSAFLRLAEKAAPRLKRLTIYTAEYDVAISASAGAHAGWARTGAGLPPSVVTAVANTDLIDATLRASDGDPYAHSYFAESDDVLKDLALALQGNTTAARSAWLKCETSGVATTCKIKCPDDKSCGPTLYQRLVHWLFDWM